MAYCEEICIITNKLSSSAGRGRGMQRGASSPPPLGKGETDNGVLVSVKENGRAQKDGDKIHATFFLVKNLLYPRRRRVLEMVF